MFNIYFCCFPVTIRFVEEETDGRVRVVQVERVEAFIKLGRPDPVGYADETGPVEWETAKIYVEQVLSEYEKEQLNIK